MKLRTDADEDSGGASCAVVEMPKRVFEQPQLAPSFGCYVRLNLSDHNEIRSAHEKQAPAKLTTTYVRRLWKARWRVQQQARVAAVGFLIPVNGNRSLGLFGCVPEQHPEPDQWHRAARSASPGRHESATVRSARGISHLARVCFQGRRADSRLVVRLAPLLANPGPSLEERFERRGPPVDPRRRMRPFAQTRGSGLRLVTTRRGTGQGSAVRAREGTPGRIS